jgi:hypothetical protein
LQVAGSIVAAAAAYSFHSTMRFPASQRRSAPTVEVENDVEVGAMSEDVYQPAVAPSLTLRNKGLSAQKFRQLVDAGEGSKVFGRCQMTCPPYSAQALGIFVAIGDGEGEPKIPPIRTIFRNNTNNESRNVRSAVKQWNQRN